MKKVIKITDNSQLRVLLDLADSKRDVAIDTSYETLAVVVPEELYDRYEKYQSLDSPSPKEPEKKEKKKS